MGLKSRLQKIKAEAKKDIEKFKIFRGKRRAKALLKLKKKRLKLEGQARIQEAKRSELQKIQKAKEVIRGPKKKGKSLLDVILGSSKKKRKRKSKRKMKIMKKKTMPRKKRRSRRSSSSIDSFLGF